MKIVHFIFKISSLRTTLPSSEAVHLLIHAHFMSLAEDGVSSLGNNHFSTSGGSSPKGHTQLQRGSISLNKRSASYGFYDTSVLFYLKGVAKLMLVELSN